MKLDDELYRSLKLAKAMQKAKDREKAPRRKHGPAYQCHACGKTFHVRWLFDHHHCPQKVHSQE